MSEVSNLRSACAEAARRGGAVLRAKWGQQRTIELKEGNDLVTDADRASEAAVLGFLHAEFPGAAVLAEESGASGGPPGGVRFYVDPLDGTTNYAHGVPHFAVTVGASDSRGLAAGATLDPLRDEMFTAGRGEGAALGETRIRHSGRAEIRGALLVTGFPHDVHDRGDLPLRLFGAFTVRSRGVRRLGAAAIDLAWVACGRLDGVWELRLKPWDVAAGIVIAREAGAIVTDLGGGAAMLESGEVLVAPPELHGRMREVVRAELGR